MKTYFLTIFIYLSSIVCIYSQDLKTPYYLCPRGGEQHLDLSENWELNYTDDAIQSLNGLPDNDWVTADEPTSVQMAWFKAGKLPDPYAHLNAEKYTWMEEKVWYYRKTVNIPEHAKNGYVFLAFDGIDYFSRIWFNGKLLGSHEGMWGGPMIQINDHMQPGKENEIVVEVKSGNYNQWNSFDWRNPGTIIKTRTFAGGGSHKPFFALGMWRGARIEMVPDIHMERPFLQTKRVSEDVAKLHLSVEFFVNSHSLQHQLHPWHETQISNYSNIKLAPDKVIIPEDLELEIAFKFANNVEFSETFEVLSLKGRSWIEKDFLLYNPKLWHPNGLGQPNLYNVELSLLKNGKSIDNISFNYGIRTIEQVSSAGPRTGDRWKNWQFVVNNREFFVKGINWMPSDPLYDFPKEKYEWLIRTAAKGGIQMIRIWGGGLFETEEFFEACNRHGIMVWQDFPKNNNVTPDWPQDTWEANVVQNIIRLRNHPSLAVWCGGNEFNPYAKQNATTLNILERSLDDFDPTRLWLRTSPDHGSTHLYPDFDPVWYKKELNIVPYIAETGIHSIPEAISLYEVVDENEFQNLGDMYNEGFAENHPEFIYHFMEYSPGRVPRMLSRASHINDMSNPALESMSEATQIGAGEFYQVMSDGIQSNYPITTGLMPWVFKRPWPTVAAIHLLDGFGQPSAPYYFLKRTYEPVHVALLPERLLWKPGDVFPVKTTIINSISIETKQNNNYFLSVKIMDGQFNEIYHQTKQTQLKSGPSANETSFKDFKIPNNFKNRYFFVYVSLQDQAKTEISRSVYWPRTIPQMENEEYHDNYVLNPQAWPTLEDGPWLKPVVNKTKTSLNARIISKKHFDNGYTNVVIEIENDGSVPSFMTKLNVLGNKRLFVADDNFFWMEAGEKRKMQVLIRWRENPDKKNSIIVESWNAKKQELKF